MAGVWKKKKNLSRLLNTDYVTESEQNEIRQLKEISWWA